MCWAGVRHSLVPHGDLLLGVVQAVSKGAVFSPRDVVRFHAISVPPKTISGTSRDVCLSQSAEPCSPAVTHSPQVSLASHTKVLSCP